ncbi:DUF7373 family lipoprotein [Nocardia sp. NBC_00403]|uniref:DUF7373 family lipoprotein n=1 Tax=Nocardia sp. NBC_00403 TaxID=2975990 RepID=UPI002E1F891D
MQNYQRRIGPVRTCAIAMTAAALVLLVAACGSTVPGVSGPGEIDVRKLDVGSYPTVPYHAHNDDYAPSFFYRREVAAMRLAEYAATAHDIDPRLKTGYFPYSILPGVMPDKLGRPADLEPIATRNKLVNGFISNGSDKDFSLSIGVAPDDWPKKFTADETIITSMIMQFPDAGLAERAAREFYEADLAVDPDQNQAVPLPKYGEAHSYWHPDSPFLRTMLARGPYVVAFLLSTPGVDLNALRTLAERSYDKQLPLLEQAKPLSTMEMLQIPWDTSHLYSRALNPNKSLVPSFSTRQVLVGRQGMLHLSKDRELAENRLAAMNADQFATVESTMVAHTADAATARRIVTDRLTLTPVARNATTPANLPDSACVENEPSKSSYKFTCIVAYHEYVGFVSHRSLADAQKQAAAQYALFANS